MSVDRFTPGAPGRENFYAARLAMGDHAEGRDGLYGSVIRDAKQILARPDLKDFIQLGNIGEIPLFIEAEDSDMVIKFSHGRKRIGGIDEIRIGVNTDKGFQPWGGIEIDSSNYMYGVRLRAMYMNIAERAGSEDGISELTTRRLQGKIRKATENYENNILDEVPLDIPLGLSSQQRGDFMDVFQTILQGRQKTPDITSEDDLRRTARFFAREHHQHAIWPQGNSTYALAADLDHNYQVKEATLSEEYTLRRGREWTFYADGREPTYKVYSPASGRIDSFDKASPDQIIEGQALFARLTNPST